MREIAFIFAIIFVIGIAPLVSPSYSEYLPPNKQLDSGVLPEDIQCRDDRVLVARNGGFYACVYAESAKKMNWQVVAAEFRPYETTDREITDTFTAQPPSIPNTMAPSVTISTDVSSPQPYIQYRLP